MSTRHHRSIVACQNCRKRKVRCSLTVTGVPCIGCTQDQKECVIPPAKPQTKGHGAQTPRAAQSLQNGEITPASVPGFTPPMSVDSLISSGEELHLPTEALPAQNSSPEQGQLDEEQTGTEIANRALGRSDRGGQAPFYTGESYGFSAALDLCSQSQQPAARHILISSTPSHSLSDEDRGWLQLKGVFSVPQQSTRHELLLSYFRHVHPFMPVLNVTDILQSSSGVNMDTKRLLLMWSMFFVAANYVSDETWRLEGYASRKDMKTTMYQRAACLYHNGRESDHMVLLQSALLLSFHHSQTDMHTMPWYWTGVAISLCQIMGLHRCSLVSLSKSSIPQHQVRLWRRLWWTCFFRDRWLSLTMGRPLRINVHDCDTALPSASDILADLEGLPESITSTYIPNELSILAEDWVQMILMTRLLGDVLMVCYQPFAPSPSIEHVRELEMEIIGFKLPESSPERDHSPLATFSLYHMQLHYQAFLITFYRRFSSKEPENISSGQRESWLSQAQRKMDTAALQTNAILDNLARERLLGFTSPMTPPLLVPAMHVHLLSCKSSDLLTRRLGLNKLDLCMMALEQLQSTYPCASIFRGVFLAAVRQILPGYVTQMTEPQQAEPDTSVLHDFGLDGSFDGAAINGNVVDALLDEESIMNLWESINGMY